MTLRLVRPFFIGALALALFAGAASALPITKSLTVQVFLLCDDAGLNCASTGPAGNDYFEDVTDKIWSQAGIDVVFDFAAQINSTFFSAINDSVADRGFDDLAAAYGAGGPSATVVDMFLVHSIAGAYGEGWLGAGGLAIAMDLVMSYNGGLGRIDTIAHELGHNLGLVPASLGGDAGGHSPNPDYLMASGGVRQVPGTAANIAPDGLNLDKLPADQIALARQSSLLQDSDVPEPVSMVLAASGLFAVVTIRRRRSA